MKPSAALTLAKLPLLVARYNKQVFGSLFLLAMFYTAYRWRRQSSGD